MNTYSAKKFRFLIILLFALVIGIACEENILIENPSSQDITNNTTPYSANSLVNQPEIMPIEGQYLIIFKERWEGKRSVQTAETVRSYTDQFLRDIEIPTDSVVARFKFALRGFTARIDKFKAKALIGDPRVDYVEQDRKFRAIHFSADDDTTMTSLLSQSTPWGVSRVAGPLDGNGKTAWILDTGIDLNHSDLSISTQHNVSFISGENANDLNGHGTHVAGILAAKNNGIDVVGVAAGATVVSVKVLDQNGDGTMTSIINGVEHVVANGSTSDTVNMSLGAYDPLGNLSGLDQAVENAANAGFRIVVSAGNDQLHANNFTPARVVHKNVWTISAINSNSQFASFSNFGNPPISYAAPGEDILSLKNGGGTRMDSGTSMSAPHVAGILLVCGESGLRSSGSAINDPSPPADPIARARRASAPSNLVHTVVQNPSNPAYYNPKLDWSSVSGADKYLIERRHWLGEWKPWATATSTSYTVIITNSPNLQPATYPLDYWVAYRIRTVNMCGAGNQVTSQRVFTFDPGDSIPMTVEEAKEAEELLTDI
jgi:subtilisin family serine protease